MSVYDIKGDTDKLMEFICHICSFFSLGFSLLYVFEVPKPNRRLHSTKTTGAQNNVKGALRYFEGTVS